MATSLFDTVNETFAKQPFLTVMLASLQRMEAVRLPTDSLEAERGHTYIFFNAVLNTRLGQPITTTLKLCGDNGGLTVKGTPCKKAAVTNGRCAQHPGMQYTCHFDKGHMVPELHVTFGDDARFRPLPATVAWKDARVTIDREPFVLMDLQLKQFDMVPMAIVWNNLISDIKDMLKLPPEFHVVVNNTPLAADALWSVGKFMARHRLQGTLRQQDLVLQPGYLLGDYKLAPNAVLHT